MSTALCSPSTTSREATRCKSRTRGHLAGRRNPREPERLTADRPLARYLDAEGLARELVALPGHRGSVLVLDRDATTRRDSRLLAHLAADEPHENAALVCRYYLEHGVPPRCRAVRAEDLRVEPFASARRYQGVTHDGELLGQEPHYGEVSDHDGNAYLLRKLSGERSTVQLRWCRRPNGRFSWERVSLRDVVAALESYEPMRTITERTIARHSRDPRVTLTRLRWELERLSTSPIVLNRGLREAVLRTVELEGVSMSEIARRCGAVKRNRQGKLSGETSWLARRIGIMPEGGERHRTPWVHSDVLAVIARKGLNASPREVEL